MRNDGMAHPAVFDVPDTILFAGLFDDLADGRVVNVRYFREEVVFDLEIQSTHEPADEPVPGGEVGGGFQLMQGPFFFDLIAVGRNREGCFFHGMGQLEYNTQYKSRYKRDGQETYQPGEESHQHDRQYHHHEQVTGLGDPESDVFENAHLLDGHHAYLAAEVFRVIRFKHPNEQQQGIQYPEVIMLEAVQEIFFLCAAHAQHGFDLDIIVYTIDVGVGMVYDIVLVVPDDGAGAEGIHGEGGDVVPEFAVAERSVAAVVHDVEADGSGKSTHDDAFEYRHPGNGRKEQHVYVEGDVGGPEQDGLEIEVEIAGDGFPGFGKVVVYPFFELLVKGGAVHV